MHPARRASRRVHPFTGLAFASFSLLGLTRPASAQSAPTPALVAAGATPSAVSTATPPAHRNEHRIRLGTGLIAFGIAAAGFGFLAIEHVSSCLDESYRQSDCSSAEPLLGGALIPTGAALLFTGIPFAMLGAMDPRAERPPLAAGGVALTTLGVAAFGGSVTSALFMSPGGGRTAAAIGMVATGTAAMTSGVVMYALGNRSAQASPESSWSTPELALSPLGGSLRFRF